MTQHPLNAQERLALVRLKVRRAEKHLTELRAAIDAFLATQPYRVVNKGGSYEIDRVAPVPDCIGAIIGDVVQNLRSALDHLQRQLMLVALEVETSERESHFPIGKKARNYETMLQGMKDKGELREDAFKVLLAVQAYKKGKGHSLWVLNRLNAIDKHRIILTAGGSFRAVNLGAFISRMPGASYISSDGIRREIGTGRPIPDNPTIRDFFIGPANIMCPLKVGDKLFSGAAEMDLINDFRFDVSLNEPQVTESRPVFKTLKEFADAVGCIIDDLCPCLN